MVEMYFSLNNINGVIIVCSGDRGGITKGVDSKDGNPGNTAHG